MQLYFAHEQYLIESSLYLGLAGWFLFMVGLFTHQQSNVLQKETQNNVWYVWLLLTTLK